MAAKPEFQRMDANISSIIFSLLTYLIAIQNLIINNQGKYRTRIKGNMKRKLINDGCKKSMLVQDVIEQRRLTVDIIIKKCDQ